MYRQRRYPSEELARRGNELYETRIRPTVEASHVGRICCIDIETGDYALADQAYDAAKELIDKNPDAQIWCLRIGHVAVEKFGFGDTREKK